MPLLKLFLFACFASVAFLLVRFVAGCRRPYLTLPNSAQTEATFTPEGSKVLIRQLNAPHKLSLYDLEAKRVDWEMPVRARSGVSFSPRGTYLLVAQQEPGVLRTSVSVIRVGDRERLFLKDFVPTVEYNADTYTAETAERFAVSDDGHWVAAGLDDGTVELHGIATGTMDHRSRAAAQIARVSFKPGGNAVAVYRRNPGHVVEVSEYKGGKWSAAATLHDASWPSWSAQGLGYETATGIALWDGEKTSVALNLDGGFRASRPADKATSALSYFSQDGRYCVADRGARFEVYGLPRGDRLFTYAAEPDAPYGLCGVAFSGRRLHAFVCSGELLDVDLTTATVAKKTSFGQMGFSAQSWFHEGGTWRPYYEPFLAPNGRFLSIYRAEKGHDIYSLE